MYSGVSSHRGVRAVRNYDDATRALEDASRTPTGKQRRAKQHGFPLGGHSKSVTWVRQLDEQGHEGAIAFRLWETDVVTWYPDNSVVIENYGSVTTSGFAGRFLPRAIHLRYPVERRGVDGGDRGITYQPDPSAGWEGRRICFGDAVRFIETDGAWVPDETTLDPIEVKVRQGDTRALARRYHLADFARWLEVAPAHISPPIEHDGVSVWTCMEALEKRDFRKATQYLPLVVPGSGFGLADRIKPLNINTGRWDEHVTTGSLRKLRIGIWEREGMIGHTSVPTMLTTDYERCRRFERELDQVT